MANVQIVPQIRCDNCGFITEEVVITSEYQRPREWGSCRMEGSKSVNAYGGKDTLAFVDLCPKCANAAITAASSVLKGVRGDD